MRRRLGFPRVLPALLAAVGLAAGCWHRWLRPPRPSTRIGFSPTSSSSLQTIFKGGQTAAPDSTKQPTTSPRRSRTLACGLPGERGDWFSRSSS